MVLPLTLTLRVPRPRVPALLTSAAEPDDIDSTCVKLRVVSGTAVMVLESTSVPVEEVDDAQLALAFDWLGGSPGSSTASSTGASETLTTNRPVRAVLKPGGANWTA